YPRELRRRKPRLLIALIAHELVGRAELFEQPEDPLGTGIVEMMESEHGVSSGLAGLAAEFYQRLLTKGSVKPIDIKTKAHWGRKNRSVRQGKSLKGTGCRSSASRLGPISSETIENLVGPEPLEAMQRLVQRRELLIGDAADLLDRLDVLLIQRIDDATDLLALLRQANADRTTINARALMIEEAELDQLLQVVGDV